MEHECNPNPEFQLPASPQLIDSLATKIMAMLEHELPSDSDVDADYGAAQALLLALVRRIGPANTAAFLGMLVGEFSMYSGRSRL